MERRTRPAKGIHRVQKRLSGGRIVSYHYAWRGGPRFWTSTSGVTEEGPDYWRAYMQACEARRPDRGLFRQVITAFLDSRDFSRLAPRTQRDYRQSIEHPETGIDAKFGDAPLGAFSRPQIRRIVYQWRDAIESDRVADHRLTHLVRIVSWGVDRGYIDHHRLSGMTMRYSVDRSHLVWTQHEIEAFCAAAPRYLSRLLIAATETGLRPDDLRRLSRSHIKLTRHGRRITLRTEKRGRIVSIPVTRAMGEIIDTMPASQFTLIVGAKGRPYTQAASLGQQVHRLRDELAAAARAQGAEPPVRPFLRLYDARGTAATRLFQAGASLAEIATAMGWSVSHAARLIEVYAHADPGATDALLHKLEAHQGGKV